MRKAIKAGRRAGAPRGRCANRGVDTNPQPTGFAFRGVVLPETEGKPVSETTTDIALVKSLEDRGYLAYYDGCYWITYEGLEALSRSRLQN